MPQSDSANPCQHRRYRGVSIPFLALSVKRDAAALWCEDCGAIKPRGQRWKSPRAAEVSALKKALEKCGGESGASCVRILTEEIEKLNR